MYERVNFKNHIVENPRTYNFTDNPDGTKTMEPAPGNIIQQGTPLNAENLNRMDAGLYNLDAYTGEPEELDDMFLKNQTKAINDLARPAYNKEEELTELISGESFKKAFGKISRAIIDFKDHLKAKNPHNISINDLESWSTLNFNDVFEIPEGYEFNLNTSKVYRKGNHIYAQLVSVGTATALNGSFTPLHVKPDFIPYIQQTRGTRINSSSSGQAYSPCSIGVFTSGNLIVYVSESKTYGNDRYTWTSNGGMSVDWEL